MLLNFLKNWIMFWIVRKSNFLFVIHRRTQIQTRLWWLKSVQIFPKRHLVNFSFCVGVELHKSIFLLHLPILALFDLCIFNLWDGNEYFRELLSDAEFIPRYNIPLEQERQQTYDRLNKVCKNGFISVTGSEMIFKSRSENIIFSLTFMVRNVLL